MKNQIHMHVLSVLLLIMLGACAIQPTPPVVPGAKPSPPVVVTPPIAPPALAISTWEVLPGWQDDNLKEAWVAFLQSCVALKNKPTWQAVCAVSVTLSNPASATVRAFFEQYLIPYQVSNPDGSNEGLITGYYEPLLKGSRTSSTRFRYPLYGVPDDLLTIELSTVYPELKHMRLRGRLQGKRVLPYYSRAEIESGSAALKGREIVWVENEIELFFLQIQGSGKIQLESGETIRVGYADQNGYPYKSVGKLLVERGELALDKASMQGIQDWGVRNPGKLTELLNQNASYVFFRESPESSNGPIGALGVPLTARRSIAVDPRAIPLGAPVFLSTTWPNNPKPLNQLMLAQDTGGAIKGYVRADFFWGFGKEAGQYAGSMRQKGKLWVLLPRTYTPAIP